MLESLKRILDRLSKFDLSSWLNSITISGYKVGLDTAQKDLKEEYPTEPDMEAIVRIGMRSHALSEKALAKAKGGMVHNADKLYQEMDAAMKAGMSEKEALFQIQGRVRGLFTESYQEWELERLVRDQFLVATKEGRRAGWQNGGMKYRQWKIHLDNKTAADSKRMEGQITEIDKPYTDPLTGEKYMLAHIRPNDRCVFYGKTKVYTSKGHKQIKDVQVGDLVLTHKGRFRKVYNTYNTPRKELLYKIFYSWDGGIPYTDFVSVTGEHPFMTQRGWVRAKDLATKDKLFILSTKCKECGKPIPIFRKFCSRACISRNTAKKQWKNPEHRKNMSKKASIFWNKWNKENPEKRKEIVKASHKVLAEKALRDEHPLQRPESIAKNWVFRPKEETLEIRKKISKAVSHDNLTNPKRISYLRSDENLIGLWSKRGQNKSTDIEKRMEKELNKRNIIFTKQYNIKRFFVDFALEEHKIAIECDGWYWHQDKEKDYQRDLQIEVEGWTILHFTDTQIKKDVGKCVDEIQRVLKNHNGEYNFIPCDIKQIEVNDSKRLKKTFNLDVEEDHSFTIKGIATHNCFETGLWELPEDTIERDSLVYAKNSESDFIKGGEGSGIKGHRTEKEPPKKLPKHLALPIGIEEILYKYEYMEKLTEYQLEKFRKQILGKVKEAKKKYTEIAQYFPGDTEFERLHRKIVVDLGELENKLESAFSAGEKKIAIDAVFHLTHVHGRYAIFEGTGENIKRALDYIRDQRIHKFSKGGPGSGIKGHRTVEEKKYKNILSFEDKVRNEKKENGLLCDKDGNILLTLEGTKDTVLFSASDRNFLFNKAAGGIFTHNHPIGNSFSKADILSAMRAKLQEVRVVGKEYTHFIKFKKEVPAHIRDGFPHRYDQVFAETYVLFMHKIFNGMSNRKAQQSCFHGMIQKISKEYSEYFTYKRTTSFSKGGKGSGVRGHTTAKKEKPKLYKVVEEFEEKYRNRISEIGLTTDKEGNVLLIKKGTKTSIKYTSKEWGILSSEKSYLFTHNHSNDTTLSPADFDLMWKAGLKETRAVGPTNTFILRFKKKVPEEVFHKMLHTVTYKDEVSYQKYTSKVQKGEMKADIATIAYADKAMEAFVKEFSEYLHYQKITNIEKGGAGSGVKGHRTQRKIKAYKMIKDFENKIKGDSIESCLIADSEGKVLVSKQGTESAIYLTENERYTCREKAKKGEVIFTHNHPSSSSFSLDDILTANNFHFSETRVTSKEHDYTMRLLKPLDRDEVMTSYRAQNAYYYEIFNPLVVSEKLDRNKAWMTHTHLIWKHVAEEIDGLEYKRTR